MSLFEKLYLGTKETARDEILALYNDKGYCVISFLYFTNLMRYRLVEEQTTDQQKEYKKALENSDFLFADGIALQLFYRRGAVGRRSKKIPPNLNGTDFNPWFIEELIKNNKNIHIALYTLYDDRIGKPASFIEVVYEKFEEYFGLPISFAYQTEYQKRMSEPFDLAGYKRSLAGSYAYKLLLMSIGTPAQEIRVENNKDFIVKNNIIVLNAGGTIDYLTGIEKRAPKWVVKARVLETFWRICTKPKKNVHKFLSMFGIVRYLRRKMLKRVCFLLQK